MEQQKVDKKAASTPASFVVRAKQFGFYGGYLIPSGMTFTVSADQYSAKWMAKTPAGTVDELAALVGRTEQTKADSKRGAIAVGGSRDAALAGNPAAVDVL